jgi:hypothetical protein
MWIYLKNNLVLFILKMSGSRGSPYIWNAEIVNSYIILYKLLSAYAKISFNFYIYFTLLCQCVFLCVKLCFLNKYAGFFIFSSLCFHCLNVSQILITLLLKWKLFMLIYIHLCLVCDVQFLTCPMICAAVPCSSAYNSVLNYFLYACWIPIFALSFLFVHYFFIVYIKLICWHAYPCLTSVLVLIDF